jgi:hypothetical protein
MSVDTRHELQSFKKLLSLCRISAQKFHAARSQKEKNADFCPTVFQARGLALKQKWAFLAFFRKTHFNQMVAPLIGRKKESDHLRQYGV